MGFARASCGPGSGGCHGHRGSWGVGSLRVNRGGAVVPGNSRTPGGWGSRSPKGPRGLSGGTQVTGSRWGTQAAPEAAGGGGGNGDALHPWGLRAAWGNQGQSWGWGQGPAGETGCGCLFPDPPAVGLRPPAVPQACASESAPAGPVGGQWPDRPPAQCGCLVSAPGWSLAVPGLVRPVGETCPEKVGEEEATGHSQPQAGERLCPFHLQLGQREGSFGQDGTSWFTDAHARLPPPTLSLILGAEPCAFPSQPPAPFGSWAGSSLPPPAAAPRVGSWPWAPVQVGADGGSGADLSSKVAVHPVLSPFTMT